MVSFVAPLLICVSLAGCFVIGLAAVIRMAGPVAGLEHATGVIRLPGEVTATIVALFALATVVFVVHMLRLAWSRRHAEDAEPEEVLEPLRVPAWVRAVRQFLAFLYFVALAYVLSRSGISLDRIMALASGAGALRRLRVPRTAVPTLTGLFELARFSHHPLGPTERDQALEALDEIRSAMRVTDGDAGAS